MLRSADFFGPGMLGSGAAPYARLLDRWNPFPGDAVPPLMGFLFEESTLKAAPEKTLIPPSSLFNPSFEVPVCKVGSLPPLLPKSAQRF